MNIKINMYFLAIIFLPSISFSNDKEAMKINKSDTEINVDIEEIKNSAFFDNHKKNQISHPNAENIIYIPMDEIIESTLYLKEISSTPFSIIIKGDQKPVIYDIDNDVWRFALHHKRSPVWRTTNNTWQYGSMEDFKKIKHTLPIAKKYKKISIPSQPSMNEFSTPIPSYIHYIWIGDKKIPEHVIENIINNSQQSKNYTSIIHVHSSTEEIFNNIKNQILNNEENIQVFKLKEENFFKNIKKNLSLKQYQSFFNDKDNIFASNMLRYWIMYHYGGIFLDLRDSIVNDVSMTTLIAGPKDILLNIEEESDLTKFSGYKNSSFASQPYNPILKNIIKTLSKTHFKNEVFDIQSSPDLKKDDQGHLLNEEKINEYRENISRQVGSKFFDTVLKKEIKHYYLIKEVSAFYKAGLFSEKFNTVIDYYYPFFIKFQIVLGNRINDEF